MTTRPELNKTELKNLAEKSDTAGAVFTVLALRERNRTETDLRRLRNELTDEGFKVIPQELTDIFKDLDKMGIGRLMTKPGQPPRFKWFFGMKEVGKAAVNGRLKAAPGKIAASEKTQAADSVRVVLKSGRMVEVPMGLTGEEAAELSAIVARLT